MVKGKVHQDITSTNKSNISKYRELYLGSQNLFIYEIIIILFSNLPGALGLALRKIFYPLIFKKVGRNVIFGKGITIRHPKKIIIGDNVIIEDNCVLDAKGGDNKGITLGNGVLISRNVVLSCKDGDISIGNNTILGINSLVHAVQGSNVSIGNDVLISAYVYLVGGGNYKYSKPNIPIRQQGLISKGGISIEDNVWLGASVNVTDGVTIKKGNIIGSYSLVNKSIEKQDFISYGVPAKLSKKRY